MSIARAGIIGCGNISQAYFTAIAKLDDMEIVACADIHMAAAQAKASEHGIDAIGVDDLLERDDIDVVINLTLPQTHASVNSDILNAGKHAYCEKPFAVTREEGQAVLALARAKGLRVGCAPDTFLGGGLQSARKLIDDGAIGRPVSGTAIMACPGHESWHPNPGFYYLNGGGPLFDMGPYYITALVNMLGPVAEVAAINSRKSNERLATSEAAAGQKLPVEIDTHVSSILRFESGAVITMIMSFDVHKHTGHNIEIHGTEGSLSVPDPNNFDGAVRLAKAGEDWAEIALTHGHTDNMRGIGPTDLAVAAQKSSPIAVQATLAFHVLDVMHSIVEASELKTHVAVASRCDRPAALPVGLANGAMD